MPLHRGEYLPSGIGTAGAAHVPAGHAMGMCLPFLEGDVVKMHPHFFAPFSIFGYNFQTPRAAWDCFRRAERGVGAQWRSFVGETLGAPTTALRSTIGPLV